MKFKINDKRWILAIVVIIIIILLIVFYSEFSSIGNFTTKIHRPPTPIY